MKFKDYQLNKEGIAKLHLEPNLRETEPTSKSSNLASKASFAIPSKYLFFALSLFMSFLNCHEILLEGKGVDERAFAVQDSPDEYEKILEEVVIELFDIGAIQFGSFKLKNGSESSYYIDLRRAISKPKLLARMSHLMRQKIADKECDAVCGVPYAALALCTGIALYHDKPMIMVRKEAKDHGTLQLIEGVYRKGDQVLIVEDVITTGGSILSTVQTLEAEGIIVKNAVVFLDREENGIGRLEAIGVHVDSVLSVSKFLSILNRSGHLEKTPPKDSTLQASKPLSYAERAQMSTHPLSRELFLLMEEKQTNLAASADIPNKKALLDFADAIGPYICVLKTHADIIEGFDGEFILSLQEIAKKHRFLIFEDRKFADIGNTAAMQYQGGVHKISSWARIINAHALPGPGLIEALSKVGKPHGAGLLLIPQMSSSGALTDGFYAQKTVQLALEHKSFVIGFIAQKKLTDDPHFIYLMPGIHLGSKGDQLGQKYVTPYEAIVDHGTDIIIVGRGLYETQDIQSTGEKYRKAGWDAYLQRSLTPLRQQ